MFDGERGESFREGVTVVLPPVRRVSKLSTIGDFFTPQAEVSFWPRKRENIDAQVPGITHRGRLRIETDPTRVQQRREEKLRREQALEAERVRARQRAEELRAGMRRAMRQMDRERVMQMEDMKNVAIVGGTFIGGMAALGAIAAIYLEFQSIVASIPSALSGLEAFAGTVLVAGSEALRTLLTILAAGDMTLISATALITLSLSFAALRATFSGIDVRKHREGYRK